MKKYFLLLCVLFSTTLFAQNWVAVTETVTTDVWAFDWLNASVVWASATTSTATATQVAKSVDGGATWTSVTNVPNGGGYGICVFNATTACVSTGPSSGVGKIFRTTDGGTTWTEAYVGPTGAWFNFIDNISATEGWAQSDPIGGLFHIVKTTDAGATWSLASGLPTPSTGAAGANGSFYRIGDVCWFGESSAPKVWKSTTKYNGPWTSGNATANSIGTLAFSSATGPGVCAFWSNTTTINRTTDGGATWAAQAMTLGTVNGLEYVVGTNYVWAATTTGIWQSSNNGVAWTQNTRPTGVTAAMNVVRYFGDANVGVSGGVGGVILKSALPPVVPVELTSFTAASLNGTVTLNWTTATEVNNRGFEVERSSDNTNYSVVGFINGNGTTTETQNYSFVDKNLAQGTYYYRLRQIDFNGQFEYSNVAEAIVSAPIEFSLNQNYPNPFNPSTKIAYSVPVAGNVKLAVYNLLGQEVSTLVDGFKEAGNYELNFDASNLTSGTYIYKIETAQFTQARKMMLTK